MLFDKFSTNGIRMPRVAGLILAAVVLPFLASTARADCGEYVHVEKEAVAVGDSSRTTTRPVDRHMPCHGPNCSKAPERSPLLPVVTQNAPIEHLACLFTDRVVPINGMGTRTIPDNSSLPDYHTSRLERPPRF
ncbi:MAG TPA: hypothetical protein VGL71_04590 [Urbifossiella sp.]